jgi:hypothetical protein
MIARKTRQIKEHGVSDLAGFLHIQLLFILLSSSFGLKGRRLLYYVYQKLHVAWPRLCRTIGFFLLDTTRFWALANWIQPLKYRSFAADRLRRSEANNRSQQGIARQVRSHQRKTVTTLLQQDIASQQVCTSEASSDSNY